MRNVLAVLGGTLLALAFPKAGVAGFAWAAPGLMLCAALGVPGKRAFRLGYLGGLAFFLISLYWLLFIPFPAGAIAGWLALGAYCALYPAVWVWLCVRLFPAAPLVEGSLLDFFSGFQQTRWSKRQWWVLQCAALWVGLEILRGHLLTGFPWNLLGVSQGELPPLIQIASITGVYGVSFGVVFFSVSLIPALSAMVTKPAAPWSWIKETLPAFLIVAGMVWFGLQELSRDAAAGEKRIRLALIQPNIPQELIWQSDESVYQMRFEKVMRLSRQALAENPDVLLWPESALPPLEPEDFLSIIEMLNRHRVWMILGADDQKPAPEAESGDRYYNAAFLLDRNGETSDYYYKRRLVIFGEYVPLSGWLPFLKFLTPIEGSFYPGTEAVQFDLADLGARASALICFEDVFPHSVRDHVEPETDFLVNLTNDGWFGESAAQWQHAANAAFRAIENRVPLVRVTNNGLTCWIDPRGGLHDARYSDARSVYDAGYRIVEVPIDENRAATFYNRHGDWFGWGCLGLFVISALPGAFRRRKTAGPILPFSIY